MFGMSAREKLEGLRKLKQAEEEKTKQFLEEKQLQEEIYRIRSARGESTMSKVMKGVGEDLVNFSRGLNQPPMPTAPMPTVPIPPPRVDKKICPFCGNEIKEREL